MANYRKKGKSGLIGGIAIGLVLVLLVGALGFVTSGFKNWNAKTWFDKPTETDPENEVIATDADGNNLIGGNTYPMSNGMMFTSASTMSATYTGLTLRATIEPADADIKTVDWTVAWVNPSSTFASGKSVTEYVTVTPTSDGALTASVECVKDFGEKIKITVTSRNNPNATAECVVDFAQRIKNITFTGTDNLGEAVTFFEDRFAFSAGVTQINNFTRTIEYSNYTVTDTFTFDTSFSGSDIMLKALKASTLGTYIANCNVGQAPREDTTTLLIPLPYPPTLSSLYNFEYGFIENFWGQINSIVRANYSKPFSQFNISASGTYSTYSKSLHVVAKSAACYLTPVNSISLNNETHIF